MVAERGVRDALDLLLWAAVSADETDRAELEPGASYWRSGGQAPENGLVYEAVIPEGLHFSAGSGDMSSRIGDDDVRFAGEPKSAHFRIEHPLPCITRLAPNTRWQSLGLWIARTSELGEVLGDGVAHKPEPRPASPRIRMMIASRTLVGFRGIARNYALRSEGYAMLALMHDDDRLAISTPDTRRRGAIRAARDILHVEYADPPTLAELARRVGINRRYLTGDFAAINGTSIARYVTGLRLNHADAMLAAGLPVAEAALRVGLSPGHFAQAYRRRFGRAPSRR